jgi:ethanolamine utilization cobalamin adenosyltransferase
MPAFITESWLREHFSLTDGTEVHLPADGKLTPAARALLDEACSRQIRR